METQKRFEYKKIISLIFSVLIVILMFFPWMHIDFGYGVGYDAIVEMNPSMFRLKNEFISSQNAISQMCDSIGFEFSDLDSLMGILTAVLTCFSTVYIVLAVAKLLTRFLNMFMSHRIIERTKCIVDNVFFVLVYALAIAATIGGLYLSDMLYIAQQQGFYISINISLAASPIIIMLLLMIDSKMDSM